MEALMIDKDLLPLIIGLGAPTLITIGGVLTWFLKSKREELLAAEERALERRVEIYNEIMYPFIVLFTKGATKKDKENASKTMLSIKYKKAAFSLITFGSDDMVNSFNKMMQGFYKGETDKNPVEAMKNFANFLLAIRKDVYNKNTKMKEWDMLKFMITDIDNLINN